MVHKLLGHSDFSATVFYTHQMPKHENLALTCEISHHPVETGRLRVSSQ